MSFLDSQQDAAEDQTPPAGPPQGGGPPAGPPGGPPQGGGPILAAIAGRQRSAQPSAPGPGDAAHALTLMTQAVGLIQQALPGLQTGTPMHTSALRAVTQLSRHIPGGAPSAGVQQTQLQDLLKNVIKNALVSRIMNQRGQQQGSGGPDMPAGAAPAPMPSTPLPGA